MITDNQVKKLKKNLSGGKSLVISALQAGMDEKTARKYRDLDKLPSELKASSDRWWRTHAYPFGGVWEELEPFLKQIQALRQKRFLIICSANMETGTNRGLARFLWINSQ